MVKLNEIRVADIVAGDVVESKFQAFLKATVERGSIYVYGNRPWSWDDVNSCWVIDDNRYGCEGFASCFLGFWFNFNQHFGEFWGHLDGNMAGFSTSISEYGLKEFVDGLSSVNIGDRSYDASIGGTYEDLIENEVLIKNGSGNVYKFNPSSLNDFNVFTEGTHHWGLYVKRGSSQDGKRVPNDEDESNEIWRMAADGYGYGIREADINRANDRLVSTLNTIRNANTEQIWMNIPFQYAGLEDKWRDICTQVEGIEQKWSDIRDEFSTAAPGDNQEYNLTGPKMNEVVRSITRANRKISEVDEKFNQIIEKTQNDQRIAPYEWVGLSRTMDELKKMVGELGEVVDESRSWKCSRSRSRQGYSYCCWLADPKRTTWRAEKKTITSSAMKKTILIWKLKDLTSEGKAPSVGIPSPILNNSPANIRYPAP